MLFKNNTKIVISVTSPGNGLLKYKSSPEFLDEYFNCISRKSIVKRFISYCGNKLIVKKNGTAKFLLFFERLLLQIDLLDSNNFFED